MSASAERRARGLRARNRARTLAAIQHEAFKLFRRQGYEATTVEQIAAAAEVSQSTFFRYFPTKEAVVISDEFDPIIAAAFLAQPPEVGPLEALRNALRSAAAEMSTSRRDDLEFRARLMWQVPALRGTALAQLTATMNLIAQLLGERLHRDPDDLQVRTTAGAITGSTIALITTWAETPAGSNLMEAFDEALAFLEQGLPIGTRS